MNKKIITQLSLVAALAVVGTAAFFAFRKGELGNSGHPSGTQNPVREEGDAARIAKVDAEIAAKRRAEGQGLAAGATPAADSTKATSYGKLKPIPASATVQTRLAAEAVMTKTHPERLSCAIMPPPFDAEKWAKDANGYRKTYIDEPAPGRCYQSKQPGPGVNRITLACPAYIETEQGQPVTLRVKATPGMPVTFTSFDAAMFVDTQVTTQNVIADENGLASVQLLATPGVIAQCRVRAACPTDAGAAVMTVYAKLPNQSSSTIAQK